MVKREIWPSCQVLITIAIMQEVRILVSMLLGRIDSMNIIICSKSELLSCEVSSLNLEINKY